HLTAVAKERLKVLSDITGLARFLFEEPAWDDLSIFAAKGVELPLAHTALERAYTVLLSGLEAKKEQSVIEEELAQLAKDLGMKVNGVFQPLRVAITGSTVSLPLFDSIELLGFDHTMNRIQDALNVLKKGIE
ncbi:MAG TPA: glutamate--tRNA ligase, partial [Sphaerochaeta sp.]|nr:glutamate--tRNA ligase [Sphaerochaeta sp.]